MIWIIIVIIVIIIAFKIGSKSEEMISSSSHKGGMRIKYAKLIECILNENEDCKIVVETRTYIRVGVSNYRGTTMVHIQQSTGNIVLIDFEVSNNQIIPNFTLHFSFKDDMDQVQMYEQICKGLNSKMQQILS
ncbi:MAG: hypothetical protein IJU90_01425 [Bacteroidales bacterium]|nr:hypothetical protein [Bacteroidales bacterium]